MLKRKYFGLVWLFFDGMLSRIAVFRPDEVSMKTAKACHESKETTPKVDKKYLHNICRMTKNTGSVCN